MRPTRLFVLWFLAAGAAVSQEPYIQQARFVPPDVVAPDGFAEAVVLSADGSTALVPATRQDCAAGVDCGTVYVFVRGETGWVQQAKLKPVETGAGDLVASVAVSADGDLALLGTFSRDCAAGIDCGAAYVFERSGGVWSEGQKLTSPDIATGAGDYFGISVALSGDGSVAFVGGILEDCPGGINCGAVSVFRRAGGLFVHEARLTAPGSVSFPLTHNNFGSPVLVSRDGTLALIRGDVYGGAFYGSVYAFRYSGGTWALEDKIEPLDPTDPNLFVFAPTALSGDGQTALLVEVFLEDFVTTTTVSSWVRGGATWTFEAVVDSFQGSFLGSGGLGALSFDGDTAVVGGPNGTARFFQRQGGAWVPGQALATQDPSLSPGLVSLSDDARTLLLGAGGILCDSPLGCRGAAYIFESAAFSPEIPTVSEVGLALLALLLAGMGAARLRRV